MSSLASNPSSHIDPEGSEGAMKSYRVYQVDAFTKTRFTGNPAGVVANADGLSETQMQAIARELNNSETAFVLSPTSSDHDVWVRFFTPTIEVPSCGHATISAHYVRAIEGGLSAGTCLQRIGAGILPVEVVHESGDYTVIMTQGRPEFGDVLGDGLRARLVEALGITHEDLDSRYPIQIVSTGHSKVLVGIHDQSTLHAVQPDLVALTDLSAVIGCNGYFLFTLDSDDEEIVAHGRMFAPAIGVPEDPVTGNGNGPLGAYLARHKALRPSSGLISFLAKQGEAMGRPGIVRVMVEMENDEPAVVRVGGDAVIAFQTTIEIEGFKR